jgi:hypothetical protein
MLRDEFSSEKHLETGERHVHICQRSLNAAFLIQDIISPLENLRIAKNTSDAISKKRAHAFDAVIYCDGSLDNEVYNLFEECKRFDRQSGKAPVLTLVFPSGKISDIKDAPVMQEPAFVKELIERLKALGTDHPLTAAIPLLDQKVSESEQAIADYDTLGIELKKSEIQEEIAQRKLRDQYRLNYLHAEERLGKKNAELFFPVIFKAPKAEKSPESVSEAVIA